jgi:dihydrofolate reductase
MGFLAPGDRTTTTKGDRMRKLIVSEYVSLNGVVEAPGGEPGHPHSGWAMDYHGPEMLQYKLDEVREAEALLLGRVTYEGFSAAWPPRDGEFADKMNSMPKHVVSSTLAEPLEWENATVVGGDAAAEVAKLKDGDGGPILVAGSATLVHLLAERDLVDEYRLVVMPVLVAGGARMFPDVDRKRPLALADTRRFDDGVLVQTYRPA